MNPYDIEINPKTFKSEEYPIDTKQKFNQLFEYEQEEVIDFVKRALVTGELVLIQAFVEQWGLCDEKEINLGLLSAIDPTNMDIEKREQYQTAENFLKMIGE